MATERKSIISTEWNVDAGIIVFTVKGEGSIKLDLNTLEDNLREQGMFHGFEQKVRDAAAIPRSTSDGASATPSEKLEAMRAVVDNLHAGVWNTKASKTPSLNRAALFEAIAEARSTEARPISAEEVEAKFRDRQDDVLRAFLTHREIAAAYAKRTARDNGQADLLLEELE